MKSWEDTAPDPGTQPSGAILSKRPARRPIVLWLLASARWLWPIVAVGVVFALAWSDLRTIQYNTVRQALRQMDLSWLLLAVLITIANLAVMGVYDVICLSGVHVREKSGRHT